MSSEQQARRSLRQSLRRQRRALGPRSQTRHAQCLAQRLASFSLFRRSKRIAAYLASDGEINPCYLIYNAWRANKKVYLPVLAPFACRLYFAPYTPGCKMKYNRFRIAEPDVHPRYWLRARQLDLIFMPLVAFDAQGNRLGMGGGFYDRSLAFSRYRKSSHRPYLIGLAHQFQCVEQLNRQAHDIPMQGIATEQQIYEILPG